MTENHKNLNSLNSVIFFVADSSEATFTKLNNRFSIPLPIYLEVNLDKENDDMYVGNPGIYIISVLLFYSCGIVILMISYMKRNTSESEDYYLKYLEQTKMSQESFLKLWNFTLLC